MNSILFFGARSGNGLWKSTNYGTSWTKVSSFTDAGKSVLSRQVFQTTHAHFAGSYIPDPTDTSGYNSDKIGIAWVTFDKSSGSSGSATSRIFVGVASKGSNSVYVSTNGGSSCEHTMLRGPTHTEIPQGPLLQDNLPTSCLTRELYPHLKRPSTSLTLMAPDLYAFHEILPLRILNIELQYDGTGGAIYKYHIDTGVCTTSVCLLQSRHNTYSCRDQHYTRQRQRSLLWIRRCCCRYPEEWHRHGCCIEFMVSRWSNFPVYRWRLHLECTLGLERLPEPYQVLLLRRVPCPVDGARLC